MRPHVYAERATLGALLLEPRQADLLKDWLLPAHFDQVIHQATYEAILQLREARGDPSPSPDPAFLLEVFERARQNRNLAAAAFNATGNGAVYLGDLMNSVRNVDNVVDYARLVFSAHVSREVASSGTRLAQMMSDRLDPDDFTTLLGNHLESAQQRLATLAAQWGQPATGSSIAPTPTEAQPDDDPELTGMLADAEAERNLLAGLVGAPHTFENVDSYLEPEHFADPQGGLVYQAIRTVFSRGVAVDPITVLYEADRLYQIETGEPLPDEVCDGTVRVLFERGAGSPEFYGLKILQLAIQREARADGLAMRHTATTSDPADTLAGSLARLARLRRRHDDWTRAAAPELAQHRPGPSQSAAS